MSYGVRVPVGVRENLAYRRRVLDVARRGPRWERALWEMCRADIFFWIDTYVWQFNPKSTGASSLELGPFICWDYQREAVRKVRWCIKKKRDLVIEKSRDMGASWLCLVVMLHGFLFDQDKKFLCVSRNADAVDAKDPDSLFWKLDFVMGRIPLWMHPRHKTGEP